MRLRSLLMAMAFPIMAVSCSDGIDEDDGARGARGKADAPGSCSQSSCGGQGAGGCWCDDQCAQFGDCCSNKEAVCDGGGGGGACDPTSITVDLEQAFGGVAFNQPVLAIQPPSDDDRWFVLEKRGVIWTFEESGTSITQPTVFADLRGQTNDGPNEAGLLGMAIPPDFAQSREVYVSYMGFDGASPINLDSRLSRFLTNAGGTVLDRQSEEILIDLRQPFGNHNGGMVAFGPDGMLYMGFGDGGGAGDPEANGQDRNTLHGSIIRIDVDHSSGYSIPAGNPLAGGGGRPELYAWGLRNPWRFSFDAQTGALWAGDVGQDAFEEIDVIEAGGNYGWRFREGAHCFNPSSGCPTNGLQDPIAEYGHAEGVSVTGGYVYRGDDIPGLAGQYIFGDFVSGRMWALFGNGGGVGRRVVHEGSMNIASFAEGNDGELYALDFASGRVFKVVGDGCGAPQPEPEPEPEPDPEPVASCDGHCGAQAPEGCWCDDQCAGFGDCCGDIDQACGGGPGPQPEPEPEPGPGPSCAGHCGGQAPEGCWCDSQCAGFGDCCEDIGQACGGGPGPQPEPEPEPAPTFAQVFSQVIAPNCSPCHTQGSSGGLSMANASIAFTNLVNRDADTGACSGRTRVVPGNAGASVLFQKTSGINLCGPQMPFGQPPLGAADVALIRDWIDGGANP